MKGIGNNKKGFTLVELVISIAIFMIVMIPVLIMVNSTVSTSVKAEDRQKAASLAQQFIENIKAQDSITVGSGDDKVSGYDLNYNITELSQYDYANLGATSSSYENMNCDMKLVIDSENNLRVYQINLDNSSIQLYSLGNISDGSQITLTNNAGGIDFQTNSDDVNIAKVSQAGVVKLETSGTVNLIVNASNNCPGIDFKLYLAKAEGSSGGFTVNNMGGSIVTYSNIEIAPNSYETRVIKIQVNVSKNGVLIDKFTGYKSFAN